MRRQAGVRSTSSDDYRPRGTSYHMAWQLTKASATRKPSALRIKSKYNTISSSLTGSPSAACLVHDHLGTSCNTAVFTTVLSAFIMLLISRKQHHAEKRRSLVHQQLFMRSVLVLDCEYEVAMKYETASTTTTGSYDFFYQAYRTVTNTHK